MPETGFVPINGSVKEFVACMLVEQQDEKRRRVLGHLSGMRPAVEGCDVCWRKPNIEMLKCNIDSARVAIWDGLLLCAMKQVVL
ncbi:hypothetical protein CXB51_011381 [Gossypium anomalum]|uniref:Uncharacterized protein n=1 Tax=Gossypium anomalum TaxID=47600 RepID=A0A8J6D575_9ROSI|nr:hypothetical protein CXB51_011381 [Gossypium anomalum]